MEVAKPPVKQIMKPQPWFKWICTWELGKRKKHKCGEPIEGPAKGLVEHSSDQHWEKHKREAQ